MENFIRRSAMVFENGSPLVIPAEPITKPAPTTTPTPKPDQDDPFNVPAPLVDPTPKGFF